MSVIKGSRKVYVGFIFLSVGILITALRGDVPNNLLSLMEALYASFVVGNGAEYVSQAIANKGKKE
jgi:hypothetical protein